MTAVKVAPLIGAVEDDEEVRSWSELADEFIGVADGADEEMRRRDLMGERQDLYRLGRAGAERMAGERIRYLIPRLTAGSRPRAVTYAWLVGRHVDMERPSRPDEVAAGYPQTTGMRCLVEGVEDIPTGVRIVTDEGLSMTVTGEDEHLWRFAIRATAWEERS